MQNVGHENSKLRLEPGGQVRLLTFHKGTIDRLVSFKTMAYLQSSLLLAPQASLHTPREELMERARSYQATLEVMYVQDHPHLGRLIHSDPRSYLQSLLSQCYEEILNMKGASGAVKFENSNFVRASSLRHRSLRHRLRPTTAPTPTTMLTTMLMAETPPSRCAGGARGRRGSEPGPCPSSCA